jgi:fatty acid desaturase
MIDDIFIQDLMIAPFVLHKMPKVMQQMIARFQHLYFIPILIFVGPYYIKMLAFARERRPWEHFGQSLYWVWVAALLRFFPSWQEGLAYYMVGNMFLGVLSIQLLVSHYGRSWSEKQSTKGHWAERQLEAVLDIDCPLWLDWFHGGLHLHSPHHLFPRMSRYYYRAAHKDILEMCTKNGLVLDVECWFPAVVATLEHLRLVGLQLQAMQSKMA